MKTRMSLVDVIAVVRELQVLVGYRVNNVYDLNAKTYLMKLHKSGGGTGNTSKAQLLMESGTRLHLTRFDHAKVGARAAQGRGVWCGRAACSRASG